VLELYSLANATSGRSAAVLAKAKSLSGDAAFDAAHGVLIVRGPATMQRDLLAWLQAEKSLAADPR
jgi:hypothetical protein